jgi:hypothetical protein
MYEQGVRVELNHSTFRLHEFKTLPIYQYQYHTGANGSAETFCFNNTVSIDTG